MRPDDQTGHKNEPDYRISEELYGIFMIHPVSQKWEKSSGVALIKVMWWQRHEERKH